MIMAGVVTPQDVADLVQSILPELDRMNWEQIAQNLQDYEMMSHWLKDDKIVFGDGIAIRKNLLSSLSGAASHTGMTDTDDVDIPDLMDDITVPWRHAQSKWGYHYQTDILMNRGKSTINDTVKPRRHAAMIDLAEELEAKAWQVPNSTDKLNPYGLPYWIVYNSSTGFNGGYPTGPDAVTHTSIAGLSLTDSPKFKNYTANYTAVSKQDLLPKMRTALRKTNFRSPVTKEDMSTPRGNDRRYYCDEQTCSDFENVGEAQNENLGRDLAPYTAGSGNGGIQDVDGTLTFKKNPIVYVPQLDDTNVFTAATSPVYQIDHGVFYPYCLKGDYLRETGPVVAPNQHNMYRVFLDLTYNIICTNRRRCAVFGK
jgi:hypothetical protein